MSTKLLLLALLLTAAPTWAKPPKGKPPAAVTTHTVVVRMVPPPEQARRTEERIACLVEQARFQSETQHRARQCEIKANDVRQCIARVRERQSSNTGKGALLGLGAAVLTGGASLLFTGAGAVIGHQTSDEAPNECGALPRCDSNTIIEAVARETGMRHRECPAS